jgi:hypothetical protein
MYVKLGMRKWQNKIRASGADVALTPATDLLDVANL